MKGTLYGVGVGPGDPELLTLKALRLIKETENIVVPGTCVAESVAYQIAKAAYEDLDQKRLLAVPMPMTKDSLLLQQTHDQAAEKISDLLDQGQDVVFLTLGDPTIYSTYLYIHKRMKQAGYQVQIINGIPSFCAVAARLNIGLVEKSEPLHIIPASYQIEDALKLNGTKVLMKAGTKMKAVKEALLSDGAVGMMVENCGMKEEKIYQSICEVPETAGYYSLIVMKEKGEA